MINREFEQQKKQNIDDSSNDKQLNELAKELLIKSSKYKYTYNFSWMGRPIIQLPQDIMAMQEIIWDVRPDLIIETGIAHGGSIVFYASMMELLGEDGIVIGIDIDIRPHNRAEIERHPMFKRIKLIEGSSVDINVINEVKELSVEKSRILVVLDSNHTHEHVLKELELFSPLVSKGSYIVVFDTAVEDMPDDFYPDRLWGKGNNPKTAVREFLKTNKRFEVDKDIENKLLLTVAPEGYLKCIK